MATAIEELGTWVLRVLEPVRNPDPAKLDQAEREVFTNLVRQRVPADVADHLAARAKHATEVFAGAVADLRRAAELLITVSTEVQVEIRRAREKHGSDNHG
jgi:hypothetical protein